MYQANLTPDRQPFLKSNGTAEHSSEGDVLAEDAGRWVSLEGDVHGVCDRLEHRHLLRWTCKIKTKINVSLVMFLGAKFSR